MTVICEGDTADEALEGLSALVGGEESAQLSA